MRYRAPDEILNRVWKRNTDAIEIQKNNLVEIGVHKDLDHEFIHQNCLRN
jgi:hypothetical protein